MKTACALRHHRAGFPLTYLFLAAVAGGACGGGATQGGTGGAGLPGSGGVPGTGGLSATGGAAPGSGGSAAGSGGAGVATGGSSGTGGGSGTGGASASGGATGTGGASSGGRSGSGGASATGGASASGGSGAGGAAGCPANATFCSSFEETTLPASAVYKVNAAPGEWTRDFALDSSMSKVGRTSLRVKSSTEAGTSGSAYKMLAVPAPTGAFWVRFYIWSEVDLGGDHNPWAGASGSDEPNDSVMVEFAEDKGIAFNSHDSVVRPDGFSFDMPYMLPKATWHCVEISYDSQTRTQKLIINGMPLINKTDWPAASEVSKPFKTFKFGFNQLHGPARKTWYDDVVVAPQRIPCQ